MAGFDLGDRAGNIAEDVWDAASGQTNYRPGLGQVDTTRIDPSRQNAMNLQNDLALAASGRGGPSAAQAQLNAGTQAGLRQQLAMASSARGGAVQQAAARRQGMNNAAMQQGQASNEAAALRAREQQAAQAGLSNLALGQQQADLGIENANLNALTANQQQRMQIAQGNAAGKQKATGGILSAAGALLAFSDIRGKEDIQPMETGYESAGRIAQNTARSMTYGPQPIAGAAFGQPQPAPLAPAPAPAQEDSSGGFGSALSAFGSVLSDEHSKTQIRDLRSELEAVTRQRDAMAGARPPTRDMGALTADDVRALSTPEGSRAGLAPVDPYQYRYKPDAAAQYGEDTAPRAGVMAQDLEESPYLRSAVVQTPDGRLGIDGSRGLSASLAAAAGLDKRLKSIEDQIRGPQVSYPQPTAPRM